MTARKIIIDCDPGQDDAVCLLLALASPEELDVLGITAVAGNVPLHLTERNARIICELADSDVPVFSGCDKPMVRELVTAEHVHGRTGIDGTEVYDPDYPLQEQHAVDFIIDTVMKHEPGEVTLVPTGPLTNIATAFEKEPAIVERVAEVVLMGGAMRTGGNITPSAEFNIFVDPHAANIVFGCGRPVYAFGLDVTHQVLTTPERLERLRALDNKVAQATVGMLEFYDKHDIEKYGTPGGPLHDPCTIAWLLQPNLFEGKVCNVSVETQSELTMGNTVVDFWYVTNRPRNTTWMHTADADGFYDLLTERIARFGDHR